MLHPYLGVYPLLPLVATPIMASGLVPSLLLQRLLGTVFAYHVYVYVSREEGGQECVFLMPMKRI